MLGGLSVLGWGGGPCGGGVMVLWCVVCGYCELLVIAGLFWVGAGGLSMS